GRGGTAAGRVSGRTFFLCIRLDSGYLRKTPRQEPPRRKPATSGRFANSCCTRWKRWRTEVGSAHSIISGYDAAGSSARPSGAWLFAYSPGGVRLSQSELASSATKK